ANRETNLQASQKEQADFPAPPAGGSLLGVGRSALAALLAATGEPEYRSDQLFRWIHRCRAAAFDAMTDLPFSLRSSLAHRFTLARPVVKARRDSRDGSVKWVLSLADGTEIESVYLRDGRRTTLCLSSQVGCRFGCTFCATATMGLVRQLSTGEIIAQAMVLAEAHHLRPENPFNVVFMGMGEPLDNMEAVMGAFGILTDADGFGLSWRRITLSTAGHLEGLLKLARLSHRPRLAVSLNASNDHDRSRLMPINRKWPLKRLRAVLARYPVRPGERITLEYVLLAGENDSPAQARDLAALAQDLPVRVNLIPWNRHESLPHGRPTDQMVERFRSTLFQLGIAVTVRSSRGRDVAGACGQLATSFHSARSNRP
ncbi:MAG: 23S rRNA (adenine(2503)-C(2))-methyltransferase RlmN, partial [Acidobacteriota bacterium]